MLVVVFLAAVEGVSVEAVVVVFPLVCWWRKACSLVVPLVVDMVGEVCGFGKERRGVGIDSFYIASRDMSQRRKGVMCSK